MLFSHVNFYLGKVNDTNGCLVFNIGQTSIKDSSGANIGSVNVKSWSSRWLGNVIDDKKYVVKSKGKEEGKAKGEAKSLADILHGNIVIGEVRGDLVGETFISLDGRVAAKVSFLDTYTCRIKIEGGVDAAFMAMVVRSLYDIWASGLTNLLRKEII